MGFEPTVPLSITGFQDQLLKPLGHLSRNCIKQLYYYTIKSAICQEKTAKFFRRFPKSFLFNAAEKIMAKNDDCLLKKQKKQMKFCTKKKGLAFSGQIFYNKDTTEKRSKCHAIFVYTGNTGRESLPDHGTGAGSRSGQRHHRRHLCRLLPPHHRRYHH